MSDTDDKRIFEQGLAFFGAITASLSHEMNNVLAIVNELSGLQEDCLVAAEQGRPLDAEKLGSIASRIGEQVERGKAFVKQLNGFAHCVDHGRVAVDLHDNLEAVVTLCRRFARLRKATLALQLTDQRISVSGCPFDVQHVIYRCLDIALSAAQPSTQISIELTGGETGAVVTVRSDATPLPDAGVGPQVEFVTLLADTLGGTLDTEYEAERPLILTLHLPPELRRLCHEA